MSKFLLDANDNDDAKVIAIPLVFSKISRAKNFTQNLKFVLARVENISHNVFEKLWLFRFIYRCYRLPI